MPIDEPTLGQALWQIVASFGTLFSLLVAYAAHWILLIVWVVWWLLGVDWRRCWAFLAQGAWMPLVLLMVLVALVWSRIEPVACDCLRVVTVPNFWWQLGYVGLLVAVALFCGWLQGVFRWAPAEINLDPPAHGHGHGHDHGHGHGPHHTPHEGDAVEPSSHD